MKKPKLSKKTINNFLNLLSFVILFLGLIGGFSLVILSAFSYGIYIHNIDMSYNILLIANDLNKANDLKIDYRLIEDRYGINETKPYSDFYIEGIEGLANNFFRALIGMFIFMYSLMILIVPKWQTN